MSIPVDTGLGPPHLPPGDVDTSRALLPVLNKECEHSILELDHTIVRLAFFVQPTDRLTARSGGVDVTYPRLIWT